MKQTTNISKTEYESIRAKYDFYHAEWKRLLGNKNCATPEEQKLLPESPTHDEISSMEVYEFRHGIPDVPVRYFAYVHQDEKTVVYELKHTYKEPTYVTTWTGEILGEIVDYGYRYRSNMGDERVNIRVKMINGKTYSGIYFCSAGDYCRLKMCKG